MPYYAASREHDGSVDDPSIQTSFWAGWRWLISTVRECGETDSVIYGQFSRAVGGEGTGGEQRWLVGWLVAPPVVALLGLPNQWFSRLIVSKFAGTPPAWTTKRTPVRRGTSEIEYC